MILPLLKSARANLAFAIVALAALVPITSNAAYGDITLVSWYPMPDMCVVSDVYGYKASDGRYYALVGQTGKTNLHIVDVTNPAAPFQVAIINDFPTFDIEVYGDYVYGTDEGVKLTDGTKVLNLPLTLADPANPVISSTLIHEGHNIAITPDGSHLILARLHSENLGGPVYPEIPVVEIFDLADPFNPASVWAQHCVRPGRCEWYGDGDCDTYDKNNERRASGHDAIVRQTTAGTYLYDFSGADGVEIYDMSTPIAQWNETVPDGVVEHGWWRCNPWYAGSYAHSGDVTDDGRYLYICDENAAAGSTPDRAGDIYVWDLQPDGTSYLQSPVFVDSISDPDAKGHNLLIVGDLAFTSYYRAGFKVFDVSNPGDPTDANSNGVADAMEPLDVYDTSPALTEQKFGGAFGVYPYDDRGYVYVSDMQNGLFVFSVEGFSPPATPAAGPTDSPNITGNVWHEDGAPAIGVRVSATAGCASGNPWTDETGAYRKVVPFGWDGSLTPLWDGEPLINYTDVQNSIAGQDFTIYDFEDVTPLEFDTLTTPLSDGLALVDYDDDSDLDILFIRDWVGASTELWGWNDANANQGGQKFELVATFPGRHTAAAWADYDNDGHLDLYLGRKDGANELYRQDPIGTFVPITGSPVNDPAQTYAVSWVDYNSDGRVDLYVGNAGQNKLYKRTASGFVDKTSVSGLGDTGNARAVAWGDYNDDNKLDVYVANASELDVLYKNDGDGTFTAVSGVGLSATHITSTSAKWGDYNNDGSFDLLVGYYSDGESDLIYRNNGNGTFTSIALPPEATGKTSSASWVDHDGDGDLDWFATKYQIAGHNDVNRFFENLGNDQFAYVSFPPFELQGEDTRAIVFGDLDADDKLNDDGRVDAVISNAAMCCGSPEAIVKADRIVDNHSHTGQSWFKVKLVGNASNERAIGALVTVIADGVTYSGIVDGGGNAGSQEPLVLTFVVGSATTISTLKVDWPSCRTSTVANLDVNQVFIYTEPYSTTGCGGGGGGGGGCKICPQGVPAHPGETKLGPNIPNPFNPSTEILFHLQEPVTAEIAIYDVRGRKIRDTTISSISTGWQTWQWNGVSNLGDPVGTGVYFVVLRAGGIVDTRKIVLLK